MTRRYRSNGCVASRSACSGSAGENGQNSKNRAVCPLLPVCSRSRSRGRHWLTRWRTASSNSHSYAGYNVQPPAESGNVSVEPRYSTGTTGGLRSHGGVCRNPWRTSLRQPGIQSYRPQYGCAVESSVGRRGSPYEWGRLELPLWAAHGRPEIHARISAARGLHLLEIYRRRFGGIYNHRLQFVFAGPFQPKG